MFGDSGMRQPNCLDAICRETVSLGFDMSSDIKTGNMLRFLAGSVPGGRILELGTGTGVSTCWLLDGMDEQTKLSSVDIDSTVQQIAQKHLGEDPRVTFHINDALKLLQVMDDQSVGLLFADAWSGKFEGLDLALSKLRVGGVYVIDDLLPQSSWPQNHQPNVDRLIERLTSHPLLQTLQLDWSSGLLLARRIN